MPKLNDTQSVLLSTAAQREGRSLYITGTTVTIDGALSLTVAQGA